MANTPLPLRDASGMQLPYQFDADGKAYYILDNGQKQYIPPTVAASMAANDPANPNSAKLAAYARSVGPAPSTGEGGYYFDDKTGTWHDTSNALLKATTLGAGGVIAAPFIGSAIGALTGGGNSAAAGGPLAATSSPGMSVLPEVGTGTLDASAGTAAVGPTLAATSTVPHLGQLAAGAGASGAGAGMPTWLTTALKAALPLGARLVATKTGSDGAGNAPQDLQQLLALALQRQQQQQPLFEAATNQALKGLPTYAQQGLPKAGG